MSNLQHCTSLQEATGKIDYRLMNDCMFHVVFQKNPKALRGLCASLLHISPEEILSVEVLNVKSHEIYSSKFVLSVVNLNQIELATEEDRKYGIDHWARLFKADTWEAIMKMAQENEYVSDAAETLLQSNQDLKIRSYCEAVEEARRVRRGLERLVAEKDEALARKDEALARKDEALAEKDAEIARLKALLENK